MLFNEIVETHGIEGVASKTNISTVNLGYLVDEDFGRLNRVKALGFLLILEREYPEIDVSELRETIKAYYDKHRPVDDKVVMVAQDSVEGGSGFSFLKLFVILALLGAGYYFYTQGKLDSLIDNIEDKEEFFDDKKALESNVTIADASKVVVGKSDNESVVIETPVVPKESLVVLTEESTTNDISNEVKLALSENNTLEKEEKSVNAVVKEVAEAFLATEANASLEENVASETMENNVSITTVNVNPTRGMLWFGFINLDTKKRREFMKKVSTPFNIDKGRWLLVTGHGYLDIVAGEKSIDLADNKKHYFYIDGTELREIEKKEFRELNGRRGW